MKLRLSLQTRILLGMILGFLFGFVCVIYNLNNFLIHWIKPFGTIFITSLKAIAVPLVFFSLVKGITSLRDLSKLSKLGFRTITIYLCTTVIAITIGLVLVNLTNPGNTFSEQKKIQLKEKFGETAKKKSDDALEVKKRPPLQFLVDMFSENVFKSFTENSKMLQIILIALILGIAMVLLKEEQTKPFADLISSLNDILLKVIDLIMLYAPIGVFGLISSLLVEFSGNNLNEAIELFISLSYYSLVVIVGLSLLLFIVYPLLVNIFAKINPFYYIKKVIPIQMVAFSTSSSAATLPVTMEHAEQSFKVSKEVSGFVLPVGATINMDGTALYQAVSAVFIAQVFGYNLDFYQQLNIILTATLASIGTAGVPGAGIVMLVIVLNSIGIATEGIALIFAVERILDMFRTVVNVTGDVAVAIIVNEKEKKDL
jgi:Na+/H+-dicarboxylate symporter